MNRVVVATLLSVSLSGPVLLIGCTTAPTINQQAAYESGARIATMSYIIRGTSTSAQTLRAKQVLEVTAFIRGTVKANGDIVVDYQALGRAADDFIKQYPKIDEKDKPLARAIVYEIVTTAERTTPPVANAGEIAAKTVLSIVDQVDLTAARFL